MSFARVVADSGFGKGELALLYGVTRQSIYRWMSGIPPRAGTPLARQAEVITAALVTALDRRVIPLGAMSVEARRARIAGMVRTLQNLKLAPVK